jgi:hypothetical protein
MRCPAVTTQLYGNASPSMNEVSSETTTDNKDVEWKATTSIRANSDSVSNEIQEGELQLAKQSEQTT